MNLQSGCERDEENPTKQQDCNLFPLPPRSAAVPEEALTPDCTARQSYGDGNLHLGLSQARPPAPFPGLSRHNLPPRVACTWGCHHPWKGLCSTFSISPRWVSMRPTSSIPRHVPGEQQNSSDTSPRCNDGA